ncbi:Phospholipid ABC transporter shuttle protein MlaC [hydrothermal vent metagenome]|uniref:Phospholipid ABC transporter shuttle protein MlaC n=1 Tax=hydrothermal vent metagenome TaxID=652676 RepID=A0A3B1B9H7_9ZZZZ
MLLVLLGLQPAWAVQAPLKLVQETSDKVLEKVVNRKDELNEYPGKIVALVNDIVAPQFDFVRMSRLVLGKYWRRASKGQQGDFIEQFRTLLVRTYAIALLNYSGQAIVYLPMHEHEGATEVTVNTEVRDGGAPPIPISYRLYLKDGGWQVYDVVIDNISLVSNYRTGFSNKIRRKGMDSLIAQLKKKNSKGMK